MAENGTQAKQIKLSDELSAFDDIFPELIKDLDSFSKKEPDISDAIEWFKKVALYNIPYGKKNRGISVVTTYKHLVEKPSDDDLKLARILGWSIEILQAYFLVADDVMDQSITRRGQPCWYKQKNVGLTAINDSFFLESFVFQTIKKYIRDQPYYMNILELFLEINFKTVMGQCLDMTTATADGDVDFTHFHEQRYNTIVKWKTAFYSFYLPVAIALYMAGVSNQASHDQAKKILLQMGHFFQVQDDFLDCYGKPEVIGKIGTDIEDNKCGWLIVRALQMVSKDQLEVLKTNYGRKDPACVARVKQVYCDLDLETVYRKYEDQTYDRLLGLIDQVGSDLPKAIFLDFAKKIFKRDK